MRFSRLLDRKRRIINNNNNHFKKKAQVLMMDGSKEGKNEQLLALFKLQSFKQQLN